jgi:hypothetical protein
MRKSESVAFQFDGMFDIPSVDRDASALAIHSESGHLWTITDDKVRLVEFTNQGQLVRDVKLNGFDDAEGLCHVEGDRFLIAEEKKMRITLVDVPPDATKLKCDGRCIEIEVKSKKNKGLEGVSRSVKTNHLLSTACNRYWPSSVQRPRNGRLTWMDLMTCRIPSSILRRVGCGWSAMNRKWRQLLTLKASVLSSCA